MNLVPCACGCGTLITSRGKNGKPRRYIAGHQNKGRVIVRDWSTRLRHLNTRGAKRKCACGCGKPIIVDLPWLQAQKEQPCVWLPKYIPEHTPMGPCACGCGDTIALVNARGIPVRYAPHHAGGLPGPKGPRCDWDSRLLETNANLGYCACGCGGVLSRTLDQVRQQSGRVPKFLPGHNNRKHPVVPVLTPLETSVILGCLLGDYSIIRPHLTANPRLEFSHGLPQKDYAQHKMGVLHRLGWWTREELSKGYKPGSTLVVGHTSCQPVLEPLFQLTRPQGKKKTVSIDWLSYVDPVAMAYWFMDDGSMSWSFGHISCVSLHTEDFTEAENDLLAEWLRSKGYSETRVAWADGYPYLYLPRKSATAFIESVKDFVHPSMLYKVRRV